MAATRRRMTIMGKPFFLAGFSSSSIFSSSAIHGLLRRRVISTLLFFVKRSGDSPMKRGREEPYPATPNLSSGKPLLLKKARTSRARCRESHWFVLFVEIVSSVCPSMRILWERGRRASDTLSKRVYPSGLSLVPLGGKRSEEPMERVNRSWEERRFTSP